MTRENILKLQDHNDYCGRPFNHMIIEFMPISNKCSARFYGCDYLIMFTIYAATYDILMSDIAELINEVTNK